jgi:hypothetical protein
MCFVTKVFYGEELLEPRPYPKLEDHPVSAFRECLFNIFPDTLLIGGHSSVHNLRMCHAVVTGTHLSHGITQQADTSTGQVVCACECGDEHSGSIKCGEFFD